MYLDQICEMTNRVATLNALHACYKDDPRHPKTPYPFLNAYSRVCEDQAIPIWVRDWLFDQARRHGEVDRWIGSFNISILEPL